MKNITVSVDDNLYRVARIKAAESEFQRLAREEQELRAELRTRRLGLKTEHNLSRDELHDRHVKDGEFFISDWLRNRNTFEFLGI